MSALRLSLFLLIAAAGKVAAEETNSPGARVVDTNGPALNAVDTNSAVFNAPETNVVALREVRPVSTLDLRSFRMIWERNIFDPNRSPRSYTEGPPRDSGRPARTESFALVGTMSYEKGTFAFFESANSQYQKVLETSNSIAGYTVSEITPTHVKLESTNGEPISLRVGMEMKRREKGEWTASERAESSGSGSRSSASSGGSAEDSEVLKRLLEKRERDGGAAVGNSPGAPVVSTEKTAEETTEKKDKAETTDTGSAGGADEVLKKLLEKREKELNK